MEKRSGALIEIDKNKLDERMRMCYDSSVDWETLNALGTGLTEDAAGFNAQKARLKLQAAERFDPARILRYALRPFETRWRYYSAVNPLWKRARPTLWAQSWEGNSFVLTRFKASKTPEGPPFHFTPLLSDDHFLSPDAVAIPIRLRVEAQAKRDSEQHSFFSAEEATDVVRANL